MAAISIRQMSTETPQTPAQELPDPEMCDHEWEFVDESFDHEFGTEKVHSWQCEKCGTSRSAAPEVHL